MASHKTKFLEGYVKLNVIFKLSSEAFTSTSELLELFVKFVLVLYLSLLLFVLIELVHSSLCTLRIEIIKLIAGFSEKLDINGLLAANCYRGFQSEVEQHNEVTFTGLEESGFDVDIGKLNLLTLSADKSKPIAVYF